MAAGDKLYIADKPTLDEVNAKVDALQLKMDELNADRGREYFTVSDIISQKLRLYSQTKSPGISHEFINISGSGLIYFLYFHTITATSSTEVKIQIIVDGSTIYNKSRNTANTIQLGAFTDKMLLSPTNGYICLGSQSPQPFPYTILESPGSSQDNQASILYLPKPIRFNSSLRVVGGASNVNSSINTMYELD